jgi:hypothetical protein
VTGPDHQDQTGERLVAEILDDLQRRRDAGEIPFEYEAELDRAYATVAPAAAVGGDGVVMIEMAEAKSSIHPHAPVVARSRLGTAAKRLVRKGTFWYVSWLADAIADFAGTITQAARLVERRVRRLEDHVIAREVRVGDVLSGLPELALPEGATAAALARLVGVSGTIAVEDATELVDVLVRERPPGQVRAGVSGSAAGSLDAVILAGIVDRSTPGATVALVEEAVRALRLGGLLLVVSTDASAPCSDDAVIARELGGGRPLSLTTWRYLFAHSGFEEVTVEDLDGGVLVSGTLDP